MQLGEAVTSHNQDLGRQGEDAAAAWYEAAGFVLLDRNWRTPTGELDLVCERDSTVVFCEVKTRSTAKFGLGVEAVTQAKQRKIRAVANEWLRQPTRRSFVSLRFDVADVDGRGNVQIYESCF